MPRCRVICPLCPLSSTSPHHCPPPQPPCLNHLKRICGLTALISHHKASVSASVQQTKMKAYRVIMNPTPPPPPPPPLPQYLPIPSCFVAVHPETANICWVTSTSEPGPGLCPLDSWRADIMAAGINITKGAERRVGRAEEPGMLPSQAVDH